MGSPARSDAPSGRSSSRQPTSRQSTRGAHSSQQQASRQGTRGANPRGTNSSRSNPQSGYRSGTSNRRPAAQKKRSAWPKLLIPLAIVVALVGGFTALYFSNIFAIATVDVSGTQKLQMSYVLDLAEVPEDSTILRTDVDGIQARLMAEPWIQKVEVERVFPSTLVLHITEQPVAAVVTIVPETANDSAEQWIIAEDGTWISQVNNDESQGVQINAEEFVAIPKIRDISAAVRPESGAQETDEGITNALALLKGFSSEMRGMVASISAPDAVKTTLTLQNNVGVAFGAAEDIEAKEQAIATLLSEHEGTITYINVRVADRATYRATE